MASLASLVLAETKAQIYARGLAVAQALGITTTSWAAGDPTRSLYWFVAEVLSVLETNVAGYCASGFLDYASGDWLTILASQLFNVTRTSATYASTTVRLSNAGGGLYVIAAGDVTVKSSTNKKTYTNVTGGTLASGPGTWVDLDFVADEAGTASNAAATEIDTMVTALLSVTCSNAIGASAIDAEEDADLRDRCRAKLGMLSPNGPRDAYDYVARTSSLTLTTEVTRSRTIADATTGNVTVYVASNSGPVSGAALTKVQTALETYAAPLCVTPTATNCTGTTVDVTYELWLYDSVGDDEATIKATIATALAAMFAARPIGGDIVAPATTGKLYQSLIASTIRGAYPDHAFRVSVAAPAADVALAINAIAILGTVTPTIHLEAAP